MMMIMMMIHTEIDAWSSPSSTDQIVPSQRDAAGAASIPYTLRHAATDTARRRRRRILGRDPGSRRQFEREESTSFRHRDENVIGRRVVIVALHVARSISSVSSISSTSAYTSASPRSS